MTDPHQKVLFAVDWTTGGVNLRLERAPVPKPSTHSFSDDSRRLSKPSQTLLLFQAWLGFFPSANLEPGRKHPNSARSTRHSHTTRLPPTQTTDCIAASSRLLPFDVSLIATRRLPSGLPVFFFCPLEIPKPPCPHPTTDLARLRATFRQSSNSPSRHYKTTERRWASHGQSRTCLGAARGRTRVLCHEEKTC